MGAQECVRFRMPHMHRVHISFLLPMNLLQLKGFGGLEAAQFWEGFRGFVMSVNRLLRSLATGHLIGVCVSIVGNNSPYRPT